MPYYIEEDNPGCAVGEWATTKDDGDVMGCHESKEDAIGQALAISENEGSEYMGERSVQVLDGDAFAEMEPGEDAGLMLAPPSWVRAIARRAVGVSPEVVAVGNGNVTPAMWVFVRDVVSVPGASLWGVVLSERTRERLHKYADDVVDTIIESNEGRAGGQALSKMETRVNSAKFEVRETDEGMQFSGYAAVFNSDSEPLPFTERIAPGAFRGSLRNRNDIKLLWNHDSGQPLASTRAGNLRMTEDSVGLFVEATLPMTNLGRDVSILVRDKIVDSMSFGFTVARGGDSWNAEGTVRTLNKVNVIEASIVSFPAYTGTAGTTSVRGLDRIAVRAGVDADALADALLKIENGEDITADDRQLLTSVIDELAPAAVPVEPPAGSLEILALKKKKLELLMGA